jgi:flagellar protein FliO/FliZ
MNRVRLCRQTLTYAVASSLIALLSLWLDTPSGRTEEPAPADELVRVPRPSAHLARFTAGPAPSGEGTRSQAASGWWLGSAGIALILAVCGAVCVAARKYGPQRSTSLVQVVGRVSLSPRQAIVLVRAGPRILLIGTGTQGSPTLLGELPDGDEGGESDVSSADRSVPHSACLAVPLDSSQRWPASALDVRLGDSE